MPIARKNDWKSIQSKIRIKKRSRLALGVLALVIGLLILSWLVSFTQSLFAPWQQSQSARKYIWNKEFNINLLVRTDNTSLLSYNPKEEKVTIVNIPDETFLEVPFGFGKWQLRAVYGLGGNQLLKDTLTQFLAVPVDGFLDISQLDSPKSAVQLVSLLRENPFSGFELLSSLKTDLTAWELLRLKLSISSIRFDKIKELDLDKLSLLSQENLSDGTQVLAADTVKLDGVLSILADPSIVAEHKTIAVFNATDRPQFANQWARLITNLGGNVIITANADRKFQETQVLGEESLTLRRLGQIFGLSGKETLPLRGKTSLPLRGKTSLPLRGKINPSAEEVLSSRAQINVLLGEDYFFKK